MSDPPSVPSRPGLARFHLRLGIIEVKMFLLDLPLALNLGIIEVKMFLLDLPLALNLGIIEVKVSLLDLPSPLRLSRFHQAT
jgi:hypothetical protein